MDTITLFDHLSEAGPIGSFIRNFFTNPVLISGMIGWFLAQTIKIPIDYIQNRRWNWALWFSAGGMPSSHSALMTSVTTAIGFFEGVGSSLFGLAFVMSMIVIYDATGIRRQAGIHAQKINQMIAELLTGHPISDQVLKEVLGHTPIQAMWGTLLGIAVGTAVWLLMA